MSVATTPMSAPVAFMATTVTSMADPVAASEVSVTHFKVASVADSEVSMAGSVASMAGPVAPVAGTVAPVPLVPSWLRVQLHDVVTVHPRDQGDETRRQHTRLRNKIRTLSRVHMHMCKIM